MRSNSVTRFSARSSNRAASLRPRARGRAPAILASCLVFVSSAEQSVRAQPAVLVDATGEAVIRRTDLGADGPLDPELHRLPDVVEMRLGAFAPVDPDNALFDGIWNPSGAFMRFDLVLVGLINPPGPLAFDDDDPDYDPFRFGPNPIFGWIEFDLDADEDTGGELEYPQKRYLGNVGRFGGLPSDGRFAGRAAKHHHQFDGDVTTPPYVDRSGEEFHLSINAEDVDEIFVLVEKPGGTTGLFETGETWLLHGDLFHRAHGFESFAFGCPDRPGRYKPEVWIRFEHDAPSDRTTVSLVYPLTNAGSAAMIDPGHPVQPNDGCDQNQNSIEEALDDLQVSAEFADPWDRMQPEFDLLAGWEFNSIGDHLDPAQWRICGIIGTAYQALQENNARYAWTDVWPDPVTGDFDGSGGADALDTQLLNTFILNYDGAAGFDDDGSSVNGSLEWHDFSQGFCVYDTNYDGFVHASDAVVMGDMDYNQSVQFEDVDDFVLALLDPSLYMDTHNGALPHARGDLNGDGQVNAADIADFVDILLSP